MLVNLHITHDDLNVRAAFCLAFSAFLHIGEFTWSKWDSQSFLLHLSRGSIQFVHDGILLHLPASKSDPFRKGVSIPLSKSSDTTCPVSTLQLLFRKYPKSDTDPLFCRMQGAFDRKWILSKISQTLLLAGISPKGYSGHSFRRGAANSALEAGISRTDIMQMGRWKGDSIDRYFSALTNNTLLFSLSKKLHAAGPSPSISTPHSTTTSPPKTQVRHRGRRLGLPSARVPG